MHDYLRGTRTDVVVRKKWMPAAYTMAEGWNVIPRRNPPALESDRGRHRSRSWRLRFPEAEARRQASRCLRCNVNTVFDTSHMRGLQRLRGRLPGEPDPAWWD